MSPKKILICDDDRSIRETLRFVLEDQGYEVIENDGGDIMRLVATVHPDLILLDVRLGDKDGVRISQAIKSDPKLSHIPVVLVSASWDFEKRLREAKAEDFLKKPFEVEDLEKVIKTYLLP